MNRDKIPYCACYLSVSLILALAGLGQENGPLGHRNAVMVWYRVKDVPAALDLLLQSFVMEYAISVGLAKDSFDVQGKGRQSQCSSSPSLVCAEIYIKAPKFELLQSLGKAFLRTGPQTSSLPA